MHWHDIWTYKIEKEKATFLPFFEFLVGFFNKNVTSSVLLFLENARTVCYWYAFIFIKRLAGGTVAAFNADGFAFSILNDVIAWACARITAHLVRLSHGTFHSWNARASWLFFNGFKFQQRMYYRTPQPPVSSLKKPSCLRTPVRSYSTLNINDHLCALQWWRRCRPSSSGRKLHCPQTLHILKCNFHFVK